MHQAGMTVSGWASAQRSQFLSPNLLKMKSKSNPALLLQRELGKMSLRLLLPPKQSLKMPPLMSVPPKMLLRKPVERAIQAHLEKEPAAKSRSPKSNLTLPCDLGKTMSSAKRHLENRQAVRLSRKHVGY